MKSDHPIYKYFTWYFVIQDTDYNYMITHFYLELFKFKFFNKYWIMHREPEIPKDDLKICYDILEEVQEFNPEEYFNDL